MKTKLFVITALIACFLIACSSKNASKDTEDVKSSAVSVDTNEAKAKKAMEELNEYARTHESLNEIRFGNFSEKDWADNEYIRTLRKYIDDFKAGRIKDATLEENKSVIQGKFVLVNVSPFTMGGLYIEFFFIDAPNNVFSAVVYSDVDEKTRTVSNYEVQSLTLSDQETGLTKEKVLESLKEQPEVKLW